VIFQLSIELAEAIHEEQIEKPDFSNGQSAAMDYDKDSWFLPGPFLKDYGAKYVFREDGEDDDTLIFFAQVFAPERNSDKLEVTRSEDGYWRFVKVIPDEDCQDQWDGKVFVDKTELIECFNGLIGKVYPVMEGVLNQTLRGKFADLPSFLNAITVQHKSGKLTIFKQEIDPGVPYMGEELLDWWGGN